MENIKDFLEKQSRLYPKIKLNESRIKSYCSFIHPILNSVTSFEAMTFPEIVAEKDLYQLGDKCIYLFLQTCLGYAISIINPLDFITQVSYTIEATEIKWRHIIQKQKHEWADTFDYVDYYEVQGITNGSFVFKAAENIDAVDFFNNLFFSFSQRKNKMGYRIGDEFI